MLRILVLGAAFAVLLIGSGSALDTSSKSAVPASNVSPTNGKQMFLSYCAPCHGTDGRGGGPFASSLQKRPGDLTQIARNNRGRFPETRVISVLEFGVASSGNSSSQMPAWGPIFSRMSHLSSNDKDLRIINLIRYLESIQAR